MARLAATSVEAQESGQRLVQALALREVRLNGIIHINGILPGACAGKEGRRMKTLDNSCLWAWQRLLAGQSRLVAGADTPGEHATGYPDGLTISA